MQLKTIFNRVTKYKPFIVDRFDLAETGPPTIEITMRPREIGLPTCSVFGERCSGYDMQPTPRRFDFVPLWMLPIVLVNTMRRVNYPACGVKVKQVPWAQGKSPLATEYKWFLAGWARRMSWKEVAGSFQVSWDHVYNSVKHAVSWRLSHHSFDGMESIGIDDVQWKWGHKYQTLAYQIDQGCKRLLWIDPDHTAKTLLRFFGLLGKQRSAKLQFVCSDMWQTYLKVIAKKVPHALHVLDPFHGVQKMSKAIDKVRVVEASQMKEDGDELLLTGSRWILPKGPENLSEKQPAKLSELLQYHLKRVRSYLMKEDFPTFWTGKFLDPWCTRAMRSKIEPMQQMAKTLRNQ